MQAYKARAIMRAIAGNPGTRVNYGNGKDGRSEEADEVYGIVEEASQSIVRHEQLDHLKRVLSAGIAVLRTETMKPYFSRRSWNPGPNQPLVKKLGSGCYELSSLTDHPYVLIEAATKRRYYCFEPYGIGQELLGELHKLSSEGWVVHIDAGFASHYPSQTLMVMISKASSSSGE